MKHSNQYDSVQIGYPVLRTFMAEGFKDLEELHTGYTKYKFENKSDDLTSESVSNLDKDDSIMDSEISSDSFCPFESNLKE